MSGRIYIEIASKKLSSCVLGGIYGSVRVGGGVKVLGVPDTKLWVRGALELLEVLEITCDRGPKSPENRHLIQPISLLTTSQIFLISFTPLTNANKRESPTSRVGHACIGTSGRFQSRRLVIPVQDFQQAFLKAMQTSFVSQPSIAVMLGLYVPILN